MNLCFLLLFLSPFAQSQPPSCDRCIAVYGDTRKGHEVHRRLAERILAFKPSLVFHTGDMVGKGSSAKDWAYFNEISSGLRASAEFFPVHGNHEDHAPLYYQNFGIDPEKIWYSVDRLGIHFIVLDSESPLWEDTYQRGWLDQDIAATDARFIVVLLHRPVYATGPHGANDTKVLAPMLAPLFKKHGVSAVFSGHDHAYERSEADGIPYVVTGGGGAPLYKQRKASAATSKVFIPAHHFVSVSVKPEGLLCEVFGEDGALIDSFTAKPRAPRP